MVDLVFSHLKQAKSRSNDNTTYIKISEKKWIHFKIILTLYLVMVPGGQVCLTATTSTGIVIKTLGVP